MADLGWTLAPAAELDQVSDDWDRINAGGSRMPILDAGFFRLALQHFGTGAERVAVCRDAGGNPVAATLVTPAGPRWQTFQPAQAPLGAWVQSPDLPIKALATAFLRGNGISLGITQQDPIVLPRPQQTAGEQILDYIETASIPVSGSFADYWSARGRNLRQNLKRQRNRLAREEVTTRLRSVTDPGEARSAVAAFGLLESEGWKGEHGTALHPDNAQGQFYAALMERACTAGEGRIYEYYYDDELAASDLCVMRDGVLIILKTTHSERFNRSSPAMLMRQEAFEQLFDHENCRRIEFYGRVMDWHTRWTNDIRTLYHATYYRWPLLGAVVSRLGALRRSPQQDSGEPRRDSGP